MGPESGQVVNKILWVLEKKGQEMTVTDMQGPGDSYPAALTDCGDTVSVWGKESVDCKIQGWQSRPFEELEEF